MTSHMPTITASSNGWLINCHCGLERYADRRPAADRVAAKHIANPPAPKRGKSSAPKPKSSATWADREDSTWIDKL